jgi:hypothetical protein
MLELEPDTKNLKKIKDHQYYVFPSPATHTNQENRPTEYADEKTLKTYLGRGSNRAALLHPDVLTPANALMAALLDYGDTISDWSLQSAVIQNGYRPDDESQGRTYLRIINQTIANNPKIFGDLKFPESLNAEAQGVLGRRGDARRTVFQKKVAEATDWTKELAQHLGVWKCRSGALHFRRLGANAKRPVRSQVRVVAAATGEGIVQRWSKVLQS